MSISMLSREPVGVAGALLLSVLVFLGCDFNSAFQKIMIFVFLIPLFKK